MTTYKQLKSYAQEVGFVKKIESMGFTLGPDEFWFYRRRGDFLDLFLFWLDSSKKYVTTPIDCQKFNLIEHCNMELFPKGFSKNFGLCSDLFIEEEELIFASHLWEVETDEEMEESLDDILLIFEKHALPWFNNIIDDKKMFYSYSLRFQETTSGEELKKQLSIS